MRWLWLFPVFLFLLPFLARCQETGSGAYVRLNEKAIHYLGSLASDAFPQLLENISLPTVESGGNKVKPYISVFERPVVEAKFVLDKGVRASVRLPRVVILADAEVSAMFMTIEEKFNVTLEDTTMTLELHFGRNLTTDRNIITAEECTVVDPKITIDFQKDSWIAEYAEMLRQKITGGLRDAVCKTAVDALVYLDEQHVQKDPLAPLEPETKDGLSAAEFASDMCASEKPAEESTKSSISSPIQTGPPWSVDLTLTSLPRFTDEDVTFGVEGGVLLAGLPAQNVSSPRPLDPSLLGKKMIGVMVTDYVPNTFFTHVFDYGIGELDYRVHPDSLPSSVRSIVKMLCSKCYLQVTGHLLRKPRVEIDDLLGPRVLLAANVSVMFHGRSAHYDLVNATTVMQMTLKPTVRRSRVYGDVALTSIDFDITKLGVGGALAGPMEKLMSFVVPRTLWPAIKKRIRFAIHQRGIQLPVLCGVQLDDLSLNYTSRAAVVQTDFTFDLPLFVGKFKTYANRKSLEAKGPLVYM